MKSFMVILRCTIGFALGSSLGVALIAAGRIEQGVGLAIIGGVLGTMLALSSVLYKTSATETFSRGFRLFLKLTAAKNIPGGDKLVPLEIKEFEGRYGRSADPVALVDRMYLGAKIGAAAAVVPAILIALDIADSNRKPDPIVIEILKLVMISFGLAFVLGGVYGAAVGALTVSGVHRRNIAIGTFIGVIMGAGFAIAVSSGARVPAWQVYLAGCGVGGSLGMIGGLFSGDNFRETPLDVDDEIDDVSDT